MRIIEGFGFHRHKQSYLCGFLNQKFTASDLEKLLRQAGFENAILAWKDPEEILSLRKIDQHKFQYHIRLFENREIRGHYEYSSEGNPVLHILGRYSEPKKEYYENLLGDYLIKEPS